MSNEIVDFKGLRMITGPNTHPGSGDVFSHKKEMRLCEEILLDIDNRKNPVMMEVGCYWALWSLLFRKKFTNGKNILVELGKRQLSVGKYNFYLNDYDCSAYHGGFCIDKSSTLHNKESDIEYPVEENEDLKKFIPEAGETNGLVGPNLEFLDIWNKEGIDAIDLLHMDVQGSELAIIASITGLLQQKKIKNIIVATHSLAIHAAILEMLSLTHEVKSNMPNNLGDDVNNDELGDGYIYAKAKTDV